MKALRRSFPLRDLLLYLGLLGGIGWLVLRGSESLGYHWQWYRVPQYLFSRQEGLWTAGPLLEGLAVTLKITAVSLVLAFVIGLTTAVFRLSAAPLARAAARGYLELIRNTPLLVQLFFIYFVLAPVLGIGGFAAAVLALSLFEGAYASEIFRAGILAVPRGQWEAAAAIGLDRIRTFGLVALPQAIRYILPPLASQAISLIKDSALVSTIAIYDLTMQGQIIIAQTYLVFEIWFAVAAVYLLVTTALSLMVRYLETHLKIRT